MMAADVAELPQPSTAPITTRWRVTLADKTARVIDARGFRIEGGGLIFVQPAGCVAAFAPSVWHSIEAHNKEE
jgi:hypothetical protein